MKFVVSEMVFSPSTAEDVQSFYHRIGKPFKQVWKATFIQNSLTLYPSPFMKHAVLARTFSPPLASPMTYDHWMQMHQTLDGCLEARHVEWLYSLVAVQGDRSVCLFHVPYADAVREACRESCMPFQKVWQAEPWVEHDPARLPPGSAMIVAEVNYDPPMTKAIYDATKQQAAGCFQETNVQHLVSVMSCGGKQSVCVFIASNAEDVRSLYRKFQMPFERVWPAILIRPV